LDIYQYRLLAITMSTTLYIVINSSSEFSLEDTQYSKKTEKLINNSKERSKK
ncbi:1207_t:CDS:1, partial [Dentiscutata heterogama]